MKHTNEVCFVKDKYYEIKRKRSNYWYELIDERGERHEIDTDWLQYFDWDKNIKIPRIKFEEFNLMNIKKTGFSIFSLRLNREMKNVKQEFKGIRESFVRSLIGFYSPKERYVIHFFFFMFIIKKN